MFNIENFIINLDRKSAIFHSGETIVGSLDFSVKRQTTVKSIRLIGSGFSQFDMYEKKGGHGLSKVEGFEPYLKFFVNFIPYDLDASTLLNPGDYSYKFEIKLPSTLPPSFIHLNLG